MSTEKVFVSRRTLLKQLGIFLFGTSLSIGTVAGQGTDPNWPMFNYDLANTSYLPDRDGPTDNLQVTWKFDTGRPVPSSPAVANGTVFIGSGDGNIYALDADDGSEKWSYETDGAVSSAPLVYNNTVYVGSQDRSVYALSTADGSEQWTYETGGGVFSSPSITDDTVVAASRDGSIYALSHDDGSERWTFETDGEIWSSPAIWNETIFIGSRDNRLYALSTVDGSEKWHFTTGGWIESSPAVREETVYVGSLDNNVYALSTTSGNEQWSTQVSDVVASSPGLGDDTIYIGCRDNYVYALSTDDGTQRWRFKTQGRVFSSPTVLSESILVGSGDNTLYGISRAEGTEQWSFETDNDIFSSPSVARGTIFIGSNDGTIYALSGDTSAGGFVDPVLLAGVLGGVGLTGGGLWWRYRQHDTERPNDHPSPPEPTVSTDTSQETLAEPSDGSTTSDDSKISVGQNPLSPQSSQYSGHAMLPNEIPTGPNLSIEYDNIKNETPIGSGGNADVSHGIVTKGGRTYEVAIKKPRISGTVHQDTVDQLLDEAEMWSELDSHDHIVDIVDYGSQPLPWIAMEYMDGGDLSERIADINMDEAIWIALTISEGVHYAHRQGVAHLDLKPENILFRSSSNAWDVPKVSDWGLAKELLEHSKTVEGLSPQYAAPEQFSDEYGGVDDITDIYQLGAVLYELFTGKVPFDGTSAEVMQGVLNEEPRPPDDFVDLPQTLNEIILTALSKEKSERYDSIVYLRDALQEVHDTY